MRIRLLCVGKPREPALAEIHDRYARRLERFGVQYRTEWVADVVPGARFSEQHAMDREATALIERLDHRGRVVALHERGKLLTSEELAQRLERWATPRLTLIVGGPLGLHSRVLGLADETWSLSPLTFPHEMVRGLVTEQLYRALTILRGMPYHK